MDRQVLAARLAAKAKEQLSRTAAQVSHDGAADGARTSATKITIPAVTPGQPADSPISDGNGSEQPVATDASTPRSYRLEGSRGRSPARTSHKARAAPAQRRLAPIFTRSQQSVPHRRHSLKPHSETRAVTRAASGSSARSASPQRTERTNRDRRARLRLYTPPTCIDSDGDGSRDRATQSASTATAADDSSPRHRAARVTMGSFFTGVVRKRVRSRAASAAETVPIDLIRLNR